MENNNYVSVGNIIEQERLKRQAQIAKGVSSDVYDHIEKAHQDDLSKGVEMTYNLSRFADDVDNLNKAETEFLLSKLQRQIVADPESSILKSFRSIAIDHLNDIEKAVYADTAENRKLGRVGQEYGGKGSRGGKTDEENGKSKTNKLWKPPYELDENAVSEFLTEREDVDYNDALIMNDKESISKLRKLAFDRAKKKGVSLKAAWAGVKDKKERERIKDFEEYGYSMSEPKHWKEEKQKAQKITADVAAKFLSENADKWMEYQYDSLDDEELAKKFDKIEKFVKFGKQFDWPEAKEAEEYKRKMEAKGYHCINIGEGSSTIAYALIKKDDDTKNKPDNNKVVDSSNVGEKIISALKADQGGLNNSSAGKKAQMKIIAAAENFMKKNPKVKLSNEDLENIVGGDIDEVEEKYGELKGWNKLNDAIESYFDAD